MPRKEPLPTIADVAHHAGVSIATVSRVLNKNVFVEEETTRCVQEAIAELGYVPRTAARTLASRRTKTLGLIMSDISGAFFSPMLRGIEAAVRQAGYSLLVYATGEIEEGRSTHRALGEHNTDGLLVFTDSLEIQELVRLYKIGFPVVLMHQSSPGGTDIPTVTIENKDGAAKIVSHLIQVHGRRRIVFLRGLSTHEDAVWRERGYRDALVTNGIPFDDRFLIDGKFNEEVARDAMKKLIETGLDFDAVFSADDDSASGALLALREAGIRVPRDVALVGFDDAPFSPYLNPPLTTIHAPTEEVGSTATRQLLRLIQDEKVDPLILLPTELVIRSSCGCDGK
jgi:LacI family transcriptional regulator